MPLRSRLSLALVALFTGVVGPVSGQDAPRVFVPARPQSRQDLDRRDARALYGLAMMRQRQDRLVEAMRLLEEAVTLDPDSAPLHRALIPLYLVLARADDALAECERTLELDPDDFQTGYLHAQQLRRRGQGEAARAAIRKALRSAGLEEKPDLRIQMYYDLGAWCEEAQEIDEAVQAFQQVVNVLDQPNALLDVGAFSVEQLAEQAASTYERMIKICIQAKQYDRALRLYDQASKKHPILRGRLNYSLAQLCIGQNKLAEALAHLDAYLRTQPQGTEAYELKIRLLRELGRAREVVPAIAASAERDAQNIALKLLLAREYGRAGQAQLAEGLYKSLAEKSPSADVYRGLFTLYRETNRADAALDLLDSTLAQANTKNEPAGEANASDTPRVSIEEAAAKARAMLTVLREDTPLVKMLLPVAEARLRGRPDLQRDTRHFLAVMAGRTQQLPQAERFYRSCFRADGRVDPQVEVSVYGGLLDVLRQARKYQEIVQTCEQGLRLAQATNRLMFHYNLSQALGFLEKSEEALKHADLAVDLATEDDRLTCRLHRVSVLTQAERIERAVAECNSLLKESHKPEEVRRIRYALSNAYAQVRDFPRAEAQLELILESDSNDAGANNNLGYFWADQGKNLVEAERLIRKALDLDRQQRQRGPKPSMDSDRDNAAYLDSLGWVLFRRGQFDRARECLEQAAGLPDGAEDPTVWDHLGDAYVRLEQPVKARTAWEKALELYEFGRRRKADDRAEEVKQKLELLNTPSPSP